MSYTPTGIAMKAIEHLRQLPRGTELCSAELAEAVGEATSTLAAFLRHATERGWFRSRKENGLLFWCLGPAAYGEPFVLPPPPEPDPVPVRQTVVPARDWAPEASPPTVYSPGATEGPTPAARTAEGRAVRLTIVAGRGVLVRDGVFHRLTAAQTAFLLAAVDGAAA